MFVFDVRNCIRAGEVLSELDTNVPLWFKIIVGILCIMFVITLMGDFWR